MFGSRILDWNFDYFATDIHINEDCFAVCLYSYDLLSVQKLENVVNLLRQAVVYILGC